ncbi:putative nucleic acid-binding Zn ribbon protein [Neisseria sp. HSC-16F19]|nr:recombination protein NinG [Neisseria sp. HSC-16F19]MCP2041683.1 putative nucleic acid-binding Zn ribbon protein [Neisseria sp. HSC-16F19]
MAKRKCKVCGVVFEKLRPLQFVCSPACGAEYAKAQRAKQAAKAKREAKAKERVKTLALRRKLETVPELTKKAQAAFNRYIRLRDAGKPCISCGAAWKDNFQACHYVPAGRSSKLRFDEDNVHGGCVRCNLYESGNLRGYRIGLIHRIGEKRVIEMETDYEVKRWGKEELRELAALYRKKARELERG